VPLMEKLNYDCLLQIFSNIDFLEKIKLELVCKKWYSVLQVGNIKSKKNLFKLMKSFRIVGLILKQISLIFLNFFLLQIRNIINKIT
jgi:hypothetical protein